MKQLIFLVLLISINAFAQKPTNNFNTFNPRFEVFKLPGGELGNSVQAIVQDSAGYLWFGSQYGLHRFDGQTISTYLHDPHNSNSLAADYIESIYLDKDGILWLTHWQYGGLTAFNPATGTFTRYFNDTESPENLDDFSFSVIAEDKQGNIWVGGQGGLLRLDRKTGKSKRYRHDPANPASLSDNHVRALYVDKQGTLWVGTGFPWDDTDPERKRGGLNRYNPKTESFTRYLHDPNDPSSLAHNQVRALFEDSKGNFWVGTGGDGLHRMNRQTGKFKRLTYDRVRPEKLSRPWLRNLAPAAHPQFSHITSIFEDYDGRIWITAWPGGLNVFDPVSNSVRHFEAGRDSSDLTINFLWQSCQTKDGTMWVTTGGDGKTVFKVKQQEALFQAFLVPPPPNVLEWNSHGILRDRAGNVWISQDKEESIPARLVRINPKTGVSQAVSLGDSIRVILSLSSDRQGTMWVGTPRGQFRGDPLVGNFKPFKPEGTPDSLWSRLGWPALLTKAGQYWFGSPAIGLSRYDPKSGAFVNYRHDATNPGSLGGNNVGGLVEDEHGNLWVGGGSEYDDSNYPIFLDRFDPKTNTFEHFMTGQRRHGWATCINIDKAGHIWFIDWTRGIQTLDPATGEFKKFTANNSLLPVDFFLDMVRTKEGKLWLAGRNYLVELDPESETMSVFDAGQGILPARGRFYGSTSVAEDGKLLFSRQEGYHAFYPEQLFQGKTIRQPDLRITGFDLLGKRILPGSQSVLPKPIWQTSTIQLAYDQNVFSFSVSCFDFTDQTKVQLQFMLEGYDRNGWRTDLRDGETPAYVNVPPGEYTFRVRGANGQGRWNREGVRLSIRILPPWWKTWWAYTAYALLFLAGLYYLNHFQRQRIVQKERRLMLEKEAAHAKEIEKAYAELKATQAQLIQSEKLASLGELTAGIAHEIQNPLNFVNNFAEVSAEMIGEMKDELKAGNTTEAIEIADDLQQNLSKINHHGQRASSIVKGMLEHSRASTGIKEPTDLNALADEYLRLAYHGLRAKDNNFNAKMETHFDPDLPKVSVIPQDIGRVLLNLINNAFYAVAERSRSTVHQRTVETLHATSLPYQPTVIVTTKKLENAIEISIKDNGNGIPESIKDKIFQPFFTTKPTGQGTGLGLSLAYDIVTKGHQGTLEVKTKEGVGTEFVIRLVQRASKN